MPMTVLLCLSHAKGFFLTVLDFVNGTLMHDNFDNQPLEIVMDNGAVDDLITFFTDKSEPDMLVTFNNKAPTIQETEDLCRRVVRIKTKKFSLELSFVAI